MSSFRAPLPRQRLDLISKFAFVLNKTRSSQKLQNRDPRGYDTFIPSIRAFGLAKLLCQGQKRRSQCATAAAIPALTTSQFTPAILSPLNLSSLLFPFVKIPVAISRASIVSFAPGIFDAAPCPKHSSSQLSSCPVSGNPTSNAALSARALSDFPCNIETTNFSNSSLCRHSPVSGQNCMPQPHCSF